jgi:spermidine/putrescine transport system ATP-binding protein
MGSTSEAYDVVLERVTKRFGDVVAVRDMDLAVRSGEFFSLLGPSGCGKTTTLRMVAGFERPTSGEVYVANMAMSGVPPYRRPVNTVFQNYGLFPHLGVWENVAFGLKRKRVARPELRRRVGEALDMVEMADMAGRKPNELSGGQQQRVALARALVNQPTVLLLDEPLGALDAKLRKTMQIELKKLQREVGISFVYVTHDQEEALTMSDRVAVMSEGVVQQVGSPAEIYERPRSTFVASFIGASNIYPSVVQGMDGGIAECLTDGGLRVRASAEGRGAVAVGARVSVMIRPERMLISRADDRSADGRGENQFPGVVESVVYVGSATQLSVALGQRQVAQVLQQNVAASGGEQWREGQHVRVSCPASSCWLIPDDEAGAAQDDPTDAGAQVK